MVYVINTHSSSARCLGRQNHPPIAASSEQEEPLPTQDNSSEPLLFGARGPGVDRRIEYVLGAIESDLSRDISELARMVNLSPSRLSHLFKQGTHRSLRGYLTRRRLETAATLLLQSETSVKEVSYSVGYSHSASFTRAFRKSFGTSPRDYRMSADAKRLLYGNAN